MNHECGYLVPPRYVVGHMGKWLPICVEVHPWNLLSPVTELIRSWAVGSSAPGLRRV